MKKNKSQLIVAGMILFLPLYIFGQPVANFSTNRTTICVGGTVNFTDASTNLANPTTYTWTFESGIPGNSNAQNPSGITWAVAGRYDVTLTVTTPNGMNTVVMSDLIRVIDCKPSEGIYRIPYLDGTKVQVNRDHQTHSPSPNRIDMVGKDGTPPYPIAAAADGWIRMIVDNNLACCSQVSGCSGCNNYVWIEHPNGEWTKYTHFRTGTVTGATFANLSIGDWVCAGTYLGDEGDVGASSGGGRAATSCGGDPVVQAQLDSINGVRIANMQDSIRCGIHLHFEVGVPDDINDPFDTIGGFLNGENRIPIICGIPNGVFVAGEEYTADDCDPDDCQDDLTLDNMSFNLGDVRHFQAHITITAEDNFNVNTGAAVTMNAGDRITLGPGFRAVTNSFFQAQIKGCNSQDRINQCIGNIMAGAGGTENNSGRLPGTIPAGNSWITHFPNPFDFGITFTFRVERPAAVSLTLYDVYGKPVDVIVDGQEYEEGQEGWLYYDGSHLAPGAYFYVFRAGNHVEVKKIVKVDV